MIDYQVYFILQNENIHVAKSQLRVPVFLFLGVRRYIIL